MSTPKRTTISRIRRGDKFTRGETGMVTYTATHDAKQSRNRLYSVVRVEPAEGVGSGSRIADLRDAVVYVVGKAAPAKRKQAARAAPMFTDEQMKLVHSAVYCAWNAVAYDMEDTSDAEQNIEVCIDANRLEMFDKRNGEQAASVVRAAIVKHGYGKVLRYLAKHIPLC